MIIIVIYNYNFIVVGRSYIGDFEIKVYSS